MLSEASLTRLLGAGKEVMSLLLFMYTQCVFIFVVSGLPSFQSDLEWDEELLLHFYGKPLEYTAEGELSLFFNLAVKVETSAANRLISEVVQSRRRPLLGTSPG